MAEFLDLDFEAAMRGHYGRFLVSCPHIPVEGLFRNARQYVIVVPNLETHKHAGKSLVDWYDYELKPLGYPIGLVAERPDGSEEIEDLSAAQTVAAAGVIRTWHDLERDLLLVASADIPLVGVREDDRVAVLEVSRALTPDEHARLEDAFTSLGESLPLRVDVVDQNFATRRPERNAIELTPARLLPNGLAASVRRALEEDEDVWRRQRIASDVADAARRGVGDDTESKLDGACFVPTTFGVENVRSYLSLYSKAIFVAPLAERTESFLASLGVSGEEFKELARRGAVQIVFPQAFKRYDSAWVTDLLENAPNSVMLSRKLAALAWLDQQRRHPLLAVARTAMERRVVIRALHRTADKHEDMARAFLRALANSLSEYWLASEYQLQVRGAMSSIGGSLAQFGVHVAKDICHSDADIEVMAAAQEVEWAGALRAHLVPSVADGYSSENAAGMLSALNAGTTQRESAQRASVRQFRLAQDLLCFNNDTDVLSFVDEMGRGDLARFRDLVPRLAGATTSDEDAFALAEAWNAQVKAYERKPDRLKAFGIAGLALTVASSASPGSILSSLVPWIVPLLPMLSTKIMEDTSRDNPLVGRVADAGNSALASSIPDAVLLSRMRKRVTTMEKLKRGASALLRRAQK